MPAAQIVDCVSFLPERVVSNAELVAERRFGDAAVEADEFFRGVRERRFASPEYSSSELGARACAALLEQTGLAATDIDCVICSALMTDLFGVGIAADVVGRIGATRAQFVNTETACTSWVTGLNLARALVESGIHRRVLLVTVNNLVSRMSEYGKLETSFTLGDGASATLIAAAQRSSFLAYHESVRPELYGKLRIEPDRDAEGAQRSYWEPGPEPLGVSFSRELLMRLRETVGGVPAVLRQALDLAGLELGEVDMLLTHQPNRQFIDSWRAALGIHPPRAHDTLEQYGNMFASSIPVTLADALARGMVERGDIIAIGTFANAGDQFCGLALRW